MLLQQVPAEYPHGRSKLPDLIISRLARMGLILGALCLAGARPGRAQAIELRFPGDSIRTRVAPEFGPGGWFGSRVPPEVVGSLWREAAERSVRASRNARRRLWAVTRPDTTGIAITPEPEAPPQPLPPTTFAALGKYADV